ncbi:pentatricopeptide repeat-containing protein At4g21190 isoform X2 [Quercus robur]|uniref:pentatricopeptide repeat-containing protein At4g21190 isoform X2 n=1 Tax=Quercus robur TaxID=38942 RepID=UPI0021617338|nr:pentatricopeptide repeat-containing protein At4g21190 isoform X2 [Quercus robur]
MLTLTYSPPFIIKRLESIKIGRTSSSVVVCAAKGPRPRYPRVWKTRQRIGTISKSAKLVECINKLSNVKEEVYGALDSFIAWDLEFPLITVKKALKTLEDQREWKRIIQVTKWMLSKGQGRTMGSYFTLLNALAEDERLDEVEELWTKIFTENLDSTPRVFFDKMISIYHKRGIHEKMFEIFADMEELGIRPTVPIVTMVGNVFKELGMMDKYKKLKKKYPPPKWEYRYIKGKRVKIRAKDLRAIDGSNKDADAGKHEETYQTSNDMHEEADTSSDELDIEANDPSKDVIRHTDQTPIDGSNKDAGKHEETYQTSNDMHEEADTSSDELDIEANDPSKDVIRHTDQTPNEFYEESETNSEELEIEANISS